MFESPADRYGISIFARKGRGERVLLEGFALPLLAPGLSLKAILMSDAQAQCQAVESMSSAQDTADKYPENKSDANENERML